MVKGLAIAAAGLALVVASACGGDGPLEGPRVRVILEPDVAEAPDVDVESALKAATDIIKRRLDAFGASQARVRQADQHRVSVEVANVTAAEARRFIVATGFFEFRQPKVDEEGNIFLCQGGTVTYNPPGCEGGEETAVPPRSVTIDTQETVVWVLARAIGSDGLEKGITGQFLKPNTYVDADPITGAPELRFEMTDEGSRLLEEVTGHLLDLPMAFFLDGEPMRGEDGRILAPIVRGVITGQARMTGLAFEEARLVSILLNAGAYPVPLKVVSIEELSE